MRFAGRILPIALTCVAAHAAASPDARLIDAPVWKAMPDAAQTRLYYPDRAVRLGIKGDAVVSCDVTGAGRLEHCRVSAEWPQKQDFGLALSKLAMHELRIEARDQNGEPTAGRLIKIGARFNATPGEGGDFWIDLVVVKQP